MSYNVKSLIVVLFLAGVCFVVLKPYITKFMAEEDFVRRRNLWLAITAAAFLIPNYWAFVVLTMLLLIRAVRKDPNPVALYLFVIYALPPASLEVPVVGIQTLFSMSSTRVLALALWFPAMLRLRREMKSKHHPGLAILDFFVWAFIAMQVLRFPPLVASGGVDFSILMRRAFVVWMDAWLPYYVVSRSCMAFKTRVDALAALAMTAAVLAVIGVFESLRGWLLYAQIKTNWTYTFATYVYRDGLIRSEGSTGNFLQLGFICALGFCAWLYLAGSFRSKFVRLGGALWMWAGLLAAWSRGPWVVAVGMFFANAYFQRGGISKVFRASLVAGIAGLILLISPLGDRVVRLLPWVGTVETENVDYRQRLAERSWELIWESPFFGDPLVTLKMEDLRQGQGIIDFVNGYAYVSLFYGLVGLMLLLMPGVIVVRRVLRQVHQQWESNAQESLLGVCLLALMVGIQIMAVTAGFGFQDDYQWFYMITGLMAGHSLRFVSPRAQMIRGSDGEPVARTAQTLRRPKTAR